MIFHPFSIHPLSGLYESLWSGGKGSGGTTQGTLHNSLTYSPLKKRKIIHSKVPAKVGDIGQFALEGKP